MSTQSPNERSYALARQLCVAHYETNLRLHALRKLATLETHTTLSLKAIISCVLNPESLLNPEATQVLQSLIDDGYGSTILAVAYLMANRSANAYRRVASEITLNPSLAFDPANSAALTLMREVAGKSWQEIRRSMGAQPLDPMPTDPATLRYCSVVMENPYEDEVPGILRELLDGLGAQLRSHPFVRRVMVAAAVHWQLHSLVDLLHEHRAHFAHEIAAVVLRGDLPKTTLAGLCIVVRGAASTHAANLLSLADTHLANVRDIPDAANRQATAWKAVSAGQSRVVPVRLRTWEFCELAGRPEEAAKAVTRWVDETVAAAQARAAAGDNWNKTESFLDTLRRALGAVEVRTYQGLSPELRTPVLVHVLTALGEQFLQQHLQRFEPEVSWNFKNLDAIPHALAAVRCVVQAGHMSADDVRRYASDAEVEGPYAYRREDLQAWLLCHDTSQETTRNMLQLSRLVDRMSLEKRGCLLEPFHADYGGNGYQLCAEDLQVRGVLNVLLDRKMQAAEDGQEVVTYDWHGAAWSYPHWTAFMLAQVELAGEVVRSILAFLAEFSPDRDRGYDRVLPAFVVACVEHEEFRVELLKHATEVAGYGERSDMARQVLAESVHVDWLVDADRERVRELFRTQPEKFKRETATARALFTDEELRGIFAAAPNRWEWTDQIDAWTAVFLKTPEHLVQLVRSPQLKYGDSKELACWLEWVKKLGLARDLRVLVSLERYAFALGQHPDYHVMQEVWRLLGIEYRHFRSAS